MSNEMKYIVISQKQTIAYDDEKCLLDGKEIKDDFGGLTSSEEFAKAKQKDFYNSFFQPKSVVRKYRKLWSSL